MGVFHIYNRWKIWKTASHVDPQTVYVHMYTLKNCQQNHAKVILILIAFE